MTAPGGEMTPGRAACEAYAAAMSRRLGHAYGDQLAWDRIDDTHREDWEAAAQAAIQAAAPSAWTEYTGRIRQDLAAVTAERDAARKRIADLEADRDRLRLALGATSAQRDAFTAEDVRQRARIGELAAESARVQAEWSRTLDARDAERTERLHRTGERDEARSDLARLARLFGEVLGDFKGSPAKVAAWHAQADAITARHPAPGGISRGEQAAERQQLRAELDEARAAVRMYESYAVRKVVPDVERRAAMRARAGLAGDR